jgi:hypothetical protein
MIERTCVDCGGPMSPGAGQRCRRCYLWRAQLKRFAGQASEYSFHLQAMGREERAAQIRRAIVRIAMTKQR